ncbi:small ribosomal subunit protein uS15m-like [Physella acuta]|uniref:small ribosomal subunit protein uS15m-like n=1 Tax=Physella acuta TaxID=109671 RepID=UPI0027DE0339|nr:small ribosomal subunit protein uS15m-like [Physella acuta]
MAAPLSQGFLPKMLMVMNGRSVKNPIFSLLHSNMANSILMKHSNSIRALSNWMSTISVNPPNKVKLLMPAVIAGQTQRDVPSRHYGRKTIIKPPRYPTFKYAGDLRQLPALDKDTTLYQYQTCDQLLQGDGVLKRLVSADLAKARDVSHHKKELIRDRIIELFGPNSELEQSIASLTLEIRQMVPRCITYRSDKVKKVHLVKCIFKRKRLLTRLRELDHERFEWLLRELKIQYVIPRDKEEYKGWKHNLRESIKKIANEKQREKLKELRAKFEEEKKAFFEEKKVILSKMEADLGKYGLGRDFLEQLLVAKEPEPDDDLLKHRIKKSDLIKLFNQPKK